MPVCPVCQHDAGDVLFCPACGHSFDSRFRDRPDLRQQETPASAAPSAAPVTPPPGQGLYVDRPGLVIGSLLDAIAWFKAEPAILFGQFLLFVVLSASISFSVSDDGIKGFFTSHSVSLFTNIIGAGFCLTALNIRRGLPYHFGTLFEGFKIFIPIFLTGLAATLLIFMGIILFIVPGIVLALGFLPWMQVVLDGEHAPLEALRRSWDLMRGYKMQALYLLLLLIPFNIGGLICLLVGLFVTLPISMLSLVAFYERVRLSPRY